LIPHSKPLNEYRRKIEARRRLNRQLARLRSLPALTQDKTRVSMQANIELARDIDGALNAGAEGIGLLRTEFMFLNRNSLPNEEEQYTLLKAIVGGNAGTSGDNQNIRPWRR
jgi:phosphotransferase system enzyme I (PtsI)